MDDKHVHDHEGCDHEGCDHDHGVEVETVTISYEDGKEIEYEIVGVFEVGDSEFIALSEFDNGGLAFFRYKEEEDEMIIDYIDDDAEYDLVSDTFFELVKDNDDFIIEVEEDDE